MPGSSHHLTDTSPQSAQALQMPAFPGNCLLPNYRDCNGMAIVEKHSLPLRNNIHRIFLVGWGWGEIYAGFSTLGQEHKCQTNSKLLCKSWILLSSVSQWFNLSNFFFHLKNENNLVCPTGFRGADRWWFISTANLIREIKNHLREGSLGMPVYGLGWLN